MVPVDGDFIFSEALRPKSFLASPSRALQQSRLHVDKFDVRPLKHSSATLPFHKLTRSVWTQMWDL